MQLHESVKGGDRLRLFAALEVSIGFVKLSLLCQRGASGSTLQLFKQRNGLVVST